MSKGPSWLDKASNNNTGNKVGDKSPAQETASTDTRKKPGRKKSAVKRKQVMMSFSDNTLSNIERLELILKLNDIQITRGRSETAELAVRAVLAMLNMKDESYKSTILNYMSMTVGEEDNDALEKIED